MLGNFANSMSQLWSWGGGTGTQIGTQDPPANPMQAYNRSSCIDIIPYGGYQTPGSANAYGSIGAPRSAPPCEPATHGSSPPPHPAAACEPQSDLLSRYAQGRYDHFDREALNLQMEHTGQFQQPGTQLLQGTQEVSGQFDLHTQPALSELQPISVNVGSAETRPSSVHFVDDHRYYSDDPTWNPGYPSAESETESEDFTSVTEETMTFSNPGQQTIQQYIPRESPGAAGEPVQHLEMQRFAANSDGPVQHGQSETEQTENQIQGTQMDQQQYQVLLQQIELYSKLHQRQLQIEQQQQEKKRQTEQQLQLMKLQLNQVEQQEQQQLLQQQQLQLQQKNHQQKQMQSLVEQQRINQLAIKAPLRNPGVHPQRMPAPILGTHSLGTHSWSPSMLPGPASMDQMFNPNLLQSTPIPRSEPHSVNVQVLAGAPTEIRKTAEETAATQESQQPVTDKKAKKQLKLPTFDGTTDLEDFLATFRVIVRMNCWEEEEQADQLAICLKGMAAQVWNDTCKGTVPPLEELIHILKDRFAPTGQVEMRKAEFKGCRKKAEESFVEYGHRLRRAAIKAFPDLPHTHRDEFVKDQFLVSMDQQMRSHLKLLITAGCINRFEDMMMKATECQSFESDCPEQLVAKPRMQLCNLQSQAAPTPESQTTALSNCQVQEQLKQLQQQLQENTKWLQDMKNQGNQEQRQRRGPEGCWYCHKFGIVDCSHIKRNCLRYAADKAAGLIPQQAMPPQQGTQTGTHGGGYGQGNWHQRIQLQQPRWAPVNSLQPQPSTPQVNQMQGTQTQQWPSQNSYQSQGMLAAINSHQQPSDQESTPGTQGNVHEPGM